MKYWPECFHGDIIPRSCFSPKHFYGTETYTLELAKTMKSFGHEAVILTATPYGEAGAGRIHSKYEYDGIPAHCIDLNLKPHNRFRQTYYRPDLYPVSNVQKLWHNFLAAYLRLDNDVCKSSMELSTSAAAA